jgi:hypothetical protein
VLEALPPPNFDLALVPEAKIRGYLLSTTHPIGRFKAAAFGRLGFSDDNWETFRSALLEHARNGEMSAWQLNPFGQKFSITGPLRGSKNESMLLCSVWFIENNGVAPRLVTAYPQT